MKTTAKRLLAALLCALMILSAFAVIPAVAEETTAAGDNTAEPEGGENAPEGEETETAESGTGFENLLNGEVITFDDWDPDAGEKAQQYVWRKSGFFLTNVTGNGLDSGSTLTSDGKGGYRMLLNGSGTYVNNAAATDTSFSVENHIPAKVSASKGLIDLLYGESGPTKYSLQMDFVISDSFVGSAASNDVKNNAVSGYRGFSLVDFGGGWIIKATAPGIAPVVNLETKTDADTGETSYVKYNYNTNNNTYTANEEGAYYKITGTSTPEADAEKLKNVGYLYPVGATSAYVFDATVKAGMSSESTYMGKANVVKGEQVGTSSYYYVSGRADATIPADYIKDAFTYTAGEPFTLRFDFERTAVSGANNDKVLVTVYGIREGQPDLLIGTKTYNTTEAVRNYGIRFSDTSTAKTQIDNIKLTIAEDAEYTCAGDHASLVSGCEITEIKNLPSFFEVRYSCGKVEHVEHMLADKVTDLTSGETFTVNNSFINGSGSTKMPIGEFTVTFSLKTASSFDPTADGYANARIVRMGGKNLLNFGVVEEDGVKVGKLYTSYKHTAGSAPAITGDGSAELMTLETNKTYSFKLAVTPSISRDGKHTVKIYVDNKLITELSYIFDSGAIYFYGYKIGDSTKISMSEKRIFADNDFVIAAELNTRADYKKPAEDFELVKLGDATLLTLTKDGKVVTGSGDVMHESLTRMRTNPIFIRVLPSYGGFDVIYYKDNAEVGRGYVSVSADSYMSGLVFAAPEGLHINNIKAVTLKTSTAYPTALSGVTSKKAEGYCVHRDPDGDVSTAHVSRSFVLVPSLNVNSSGETQGVNELWYYYDCYYCGERMYVNMGENLYNSTKADYQAYYYAKNATTVTDSNKKVNTIFDGDGEISLAKSGSSYPNPMVYTNANVTKSGGVSFWVNFAYEVDKVNPYAIITKGSKGGGGSFFNIIANYGSLVRAFAVKPYEKGTTTPLSASTPLDKVEIYDPRASVENAAAGTAGTDYSAEYILLRSNTNSKKLALVKSGDKVNFTLFVDPLNDSKTSNTKIWVNGEFANATYTYGNTNDNSGYALRFYEGRNYVDGCISNFAFVLDDRAEAPKHEHDTSGDGDVEILVTDDEVYQIVDCYCGAHIKQGIVEIVKNNIENFYGGYGMVEYTNPGTHYVVTDIGLKADIESGALITLGDDVVLDASELDYTAPTTVTAAVRVKGTSYELYIDNKSVKSGTLSAKPESVTFGAENAYDNSVSFKYNKIVKLGSTSFDGKVEFIDNPVGAVCYHEGSALKFTGNSYMNTAPIDGITFEATNADGKANEVLGLKNIKARYICSVCGDSVYAAQGEALGVNVNLAHDNGKHFNTTPLKIDKNGSSETTAASHTITVPMEDICHGNKLWMSFDFTYSATANGVKTLMGRGTGGSVISLRVPLIQSKFLQSAHTDRFEYIQLVRGFAVLRPDVELDGNYTVNDYYDDRMGVWYASTSEMVNQPESAYRMVFMNGQTYKIDICIESADDGITYSTYIDGKLLYSEKNTGIRHYFNIDRDDTIPEGFVRDPKKADESVYPVEDAKTYASKYSPALRFCDQDCGKFKLSNLAMVKYGAGKDDYSGNTTVFEISATKPETAGTIASVGGVGLLSVDDDGKLIAADGNVLTKKVGEAYEDVVLGDTELYISAVLYDGAVRYYTGASRETLGYAYANGAVSAAINLTADDLTDTELEVGATVRVLDIYGSVGNAETEYITYQMHMTTPNKIRVVAANDVLYFGETGFRVRTERVVEDKTVVTETVKSSGTVFSSILAEGSEDKKITADRYGHRYFSLLELSELANGKAGSSYKMYITPFNVIEENGEAVYSAKTAVISVTVDDEAKCEQSVIDTAEVPQVTSAE